MESLKSDLQPWRTSVIPCDLNVPVRWLDFDESSRNALQTHAVQWMERSLDDSANRRLSLGQSFLAADAIVDIMHNVASGMVVYPNVIKHEDQV